MRDFLLVTGARLRPLQCLGPGPHPPNHLKIKIILTFSFCISNANKRKLRFIIVILRRLVGWGPGARFTEKILS